MGSKRDFEKGRANDVLARCPTMQARFSHQKCTLSELAPRRMYRCMAAWQRSQPEPKTARGIIRGILFLLPNIIPLVEPRCMSCSSHAACAKLPKGVDLSTLEQFNTVRFSLCLFFELLQTARRAVLHSPPPRRRLLALFQDANHHRHRHRHRLQRMASAAGSSAHAGSIASVRFIDIGANLLGMYICQLKRAELMGRALQSQSLCVLRVWRDARVQRESFALPPKFA